jgi:2-desacetyl-2-hydroxyethyl bacteriochlorophyllide A dehydrogenase
MKAAVLVGPKDLRVMEVDRPTLGCKEVLVAVKACGICTLEQRLYLGDQKIFYPIVPGHEASGVIVEVDKRVRSNLKPGDRVALDLLNRCGECYYCKMGEDELCENRFKPGLNLMGGFGEFVSIPADQVTKIADTVSYEEAALAEPLATCIHSYTKAKLSPGKTLAIIGAGPMGLLHLLLAKVYGVQSIVCDVDAGRLQIAEELGADLVLNPETDEMEEAVKAVTEGRGADVVSLAVSAKSAFESALRMVRPGGKVMLFAKGARTFEVNIVPDEIHSREVSLIGVQGRTKGEFLQAVFLLNTGKISLLPLISKVVPLDQIQEGMDMALSRLTYRVIVRIDGNNKEAN